MEGQLVDDWRKLNVETKFNILDVFIFTICLGVNIVTVEVDVAVTKAGAMRGMDLLLEGQLIEDWGKINVTKHLNVVFFFFFLVFPSALTLGT